MQRAGALALAKGIALAAGASTRARCELALIAFSGAPSATRVVRGSPSRIARALHALGAGGGTPLRRALLDALALGRRADRRGARDKRLWLLTDGRTRQPARDLAPLAAAFDVTVVDCERTRVRLARARRIAAELGARYLHADAVVERAACRS
jgi:Mg-chelatase subunit ChlD